MSGEDKEDCEDGDGREDKADAGGPAVSLGEIVGRWCFRIRGRAVEQAFSGLIHPACALAEAGCVHPTVMREYRPVPKGAQEEEMGVGINSVVRGNLVWAVWRRVPDSALDADHPLYSYSTLQGIQA